ncbi:MAG: MauE/DoxX family redox-associated membrane protein [Brevundimonas sp.]
MRIRTDSARRHAPALVLAALLATSGTIHLVRPRVFRPLIPRSLGDPEPWVLGSGVAELACAGALAIPATRRAGGWASAALLVGVFPGNVTMAVRSRPDARSWVGRPAVAWARLPLQAPLVAWAVHVARRAR